MTNKVEIIKNRFLFIFEPFNWSYQGGAIGVIAKTFDDAVAMIITSTVSSSKGNKYKAYDRGQFFTSRNSAADANMDIEHQWTMTHKLITVGTGPAMILFDNWNYRSAYRKT